MGFFDDLKDFGSTLRRLGGHWRFLLALLLLLGFGGLYLQKKYFAPPAPQTASKQAPPRTEAPESKPGEAAPESKGEAQKEPETPIESVTGQLVDVPARPALMAKGELKGEDAEKLDAEKVIAAAVNKVTAAAAKAGLKANGRPLAVFTETDEKGGFHFDAMLPIEKAPEGKTKLPDGVEIGVTPAGKALKFQHRDTYEEIEATYAAIAAYLDEKNLDMKNNLFIEEYLTDLSDTEDSAVEVDIYVFVK
jgi:effector-binding domain-containing protein